MISSDLIRETHHPGSFWPGFERSAVLVLFRLSSDPDRSGQNPRSFWTVVEIFSISDQFYHCPNVERVSHEKSLFNCILACDRPDERYSVERAPIRLPCVVEMRRGWIRREVYLLPIALVHFRQERSAAVRTPAKRLERQLERIFERFLVR